MYEPKNKIIDGIILKEQNKLNNCQVTLGVRVDEMFKKKNNHLQRQMIIFLLEIYLIAGMNDK